MPKKNGSAALLFVLVFAAAAAGFWLAYCRSAFQGLFLNDAQDYASIARNIALGKGFLSQYVTPLGLAHRGVPQPDIWRAPLWPLLLAAFQKAFGFSDMASALAGGACHVAASSMILLLGRRWFGTAAALSAAFLYLLSAPLLEFSISGMTEPLAAFLMLLWVYSLAAPVRVLPWGALLSGVALGIFYLARYNALLFLLPGVAYVAWRARREERQRLHEEPEAAPFRHPGYRFQAAAAGRRRRLCAGLTAAVLFLAGFFVAASPWLVRNQLVAGNPFFSLQKYELAMFTKTYPGYRLYMIPERVDVAGFLMEHRGEVVEKFLGNFAEFRRHFLWREFTGFPLRVFAFALLAFALPLDRSFPGQRGVRPLLLACFLLQLVALLFLHYIPRLFVVFSPFYAIYAAGSVWFLAERLCGCAVERSAAGRRGHLGWLFGAAPAAALAAFLLCGVAANLPDFCPDFGPHPAALWGEAVRDVRELLPPDAVVVSDNGQVFAWYGERFSCKLPYSPEHLPELCRLAPVRALFLTSWIAWAQPDADPAWKAVLRERPAALAGFRLQKVYSDGSLLYLRQGREEAASGR